MTQHILRITVFATSLALISGCTPRDLNVKKDTGTKESTSWLASMCSEDVESTVEAEPVEKAPRCDGNLNATLWVQTSAEYEAIARQAWLVAEGQLATALKNRRWTAATEQVDKYGKLRPAVIVDVDETILDNSPYQARLVRDNTGFDLETWAQWCEERRAEAVPGALEFAQYADSEGVRIFYVTNRTNDIEDCTRENLEALGFPMDSDVDTLLTKHERPEWGSDKGNRRDFIAADHRILLLVGDQLGDFIDGSKGSLSARKAIMEQYLEWWGTKWIIIPNPTYGHWMSALHGHERGLDPRAKADKKFNALRL
jgi:acid phosphatase